MRLTETQQLFRQACDYPIDATAVSESVGEVELEAPTGATVTVETVISRSNVRTFTSSEDLYTALIGNLDESFIGRKYYDDRGDSLPDPNRDAHEFSD